MKYYVEEDSYVWIYKQIDEHHAVMVYYFSKEDKSSKVVHAITANVLCDISILDIKETLTEEELFLYIL